MKSKQIQRWILQRQRKKLQRQNASQSTSKDGENPSAPIIQNVPVSFQILFPLQLVMLFPSTPEILPLQNNNGNVNQTIDSGNNYQMPQKKIKRTPIKASKPEELRGKKLGRFWFNRYYLFSKFNKGIQLDKESWYSVTPEKMAKRIAFRCQEQKRGGTVIDAFCGCGGNTIQFAKLYDKVIAIDIDPKRVEMCKNNATIYGVEDKIEFICGDFFQLAHSLKADIVFLSPPWGGLSYAKKEVYDFEDMDGTTLFTLAKQITPNVVFYLPRNINRAQVGKLTEPIGEREIKNVSIEEYNDHGRCHVITAYFGELAI